MFAFNINAPKMFPFELVDNILSYEGEHELVNGDVIRRVRKIHRSDSRFNIIEQIKPWYGYCVKNSERNEYVISISLPIGAESDGYVYYDLEKIIDNFEYEKNITILNVKVSWEYRRAYDVMKIEHHKIIDNNDVICIRPSTRDEYEYYYEQEDDVENVEA
jgi:hypothetical protein